MEKSFKILKKYICVSCDFECSQKCNINRHNLTAKHKKRCNSNNLEQKDIKNFVCKKCGKSYNARNSLWYHEKKCGFVKEKEPDKEEPNNKIIMLLIDNNKQLQDDNKEIKELFMKLYCENKEQTAAILELTKNRINNNTNCNNNNNTFNLNFYLNDTCKNAMNLTDFINSIQLTHLDFIKVGHDGYIKGISHIINNNMKKLAEIERPIHCTDEKRGTIYIKDADKWEKDDEKNKKLNSLIGHVATKNAREINSYKKEFPDCTKSRSKHSDTYNKSLVEAMGGAGDNDDEKNDKIKKNILKSIIIKTNK
jgi:hypothetical protein